VFAFVCKVPYCTVRLQHSLPDVAALSVVVSEFVWLSFGIILERVNLVILDCCVFVYEGVVSTQKLLVVQILRPKFCNDVVISKNFPYNLNSVR
jgi:hypothetical protein